MLNGTLNALELSRKWGVQRFVYASSISVYGLFNHVPFSEEKIPSASRFSVYAATKAAGECSLYLFASIPAPNDMSSHLHSFRPPAAPRIWPSEVCPAHSRWRENALFLVVAV